MKRVFVLVLVMLTAACSGLRIEPVATPGVTLDPKEGALSARRDPYGLEVRILPTSYHFYGMEDSFIIYHVKVENTTDKELELTKDDFILRDDKGHQVNVMMARDVAKIVEQNLFYLIPYPYVGYYSEGNDYYESRYVYNPATPHVYPVSPRDLYLDALPLGKILPKSHVKGRVYFKKRPSESKELTLHAIRKDGDFLFKFLFAVK